MDYNILVNKDNPLPRAHIPNTLVDAESEYKKNVYIDKKVKTNKENKTEGIIIGKYNEKYQIIFTSNSNIIMNKNIKY